MKNLFKILAIATFVTIGLVGGAVASPTSFVATLSGPNESPANNSPGTGFATVIFDLDANTMEVMVSFSGLTIGDTASHIHCCTAVPFTGTASVATTTPTFTGFPTGVTSGTYDHVFDMTSASSYNAGTGSLLFLAGGNVAAAELALYNGMLAGEAYLNIHTSNFPSGEIRGFLVKTPEPVTVSLFGAGVAGLGFARRRKAKRD